MGNRFASGKIAIAECDRCGQQFRLKTLKTEIIKQRKYELLVCPSCWDPDQPQLMLGTFPVDDPQALRNPRRDTTYVTSGVNVNGYVSGGSRDIQWGWAPVGGSKFFDNLLTPNYLALGVQIGTVAVGIAPPQPMVFAAPSGAGAVTSVGSGGAPDVRIFDKIYFQGFLYPDSFLQFWIGNVAWNNWVQNDVNVGDSIALQHPSSAEKLQYGIVTSKVFEPYIPSWIFYVTNPNNYPGFEDEYYDPASTFERTPAGNYLQITDVGAPSGSWASAINTAVQSNLIRTGWQVSGYDTISGQTINFGTVSFFASNATQPYRIYFSGTPPVGSYNLTGLTFSP
jgi:hypothetical protein